MAQNNTLFPYPRRARTQQHGREPSTKPCQSKSKPKGAQNNQFSPQGGKDAFVSKHQSAKTAFCNQIRHSAQEIQEWRHLLNLVESVKTINGDVEHMQKIVACITGGHDHPEIRLKLLSSALGLFYFDPDKAGDLPQYYQARIQDAWDIVTSRNTVSPIVVWKGERGFKSIVYDEHPDMLTFHGRCRKLNTRALLLSEICANFLLSVGKRESEISIWQPNIPWVDADTGDGFYPENDQLLVSIGYDPHAEQSWLFFNRLQNSKPHSPEEDFKSAFRALVKASMQMLYASDSTGKHLGMGRKPKAPKHDYLIRLGQVTHQAVQFMQQHAKAMNPDTEEGAKWMNVCEGIQKMLPVVRLAECILLHCNQSLFPSNGLGSRGGRRGLRRGASPLEPNPFGG